MEDYKPRNWFETLNCAIEGIIYSVKTQRHMKYHFTLAVIALIMGVVLNVPTTIFIIFILSFVLLLFAEIVNTALEVGIDIYVKNYHPLAKAVKDLSAGAVLISSFGVFITGYVIFAKHLSHPIAIAMGNLRDLSGYLSIVSLLVVLIGVVMAKAHFGKGMPLHGGMPSGHSAVSFSLWISVVFLTMDPLVSLITLCMALMVSHSRLVCGIHTKLEIFLGALLGMGITFLFFALFPAF